MANEIKGLVNVTTGAALSNADARYSTKPIMVNPRTESSYVVALTDSAGYIELSNPTGEITLVIPLNATVPLPIGFTTVFYSTATGISVVAAETGVTLNDVLSGSGILSEGYSEYRAIKTATDSWRILGSIAIATP